MATHTEKPLQRSSGLLLHISSLPGAWGMGDIGPSAYDLVDMLAINGQSLWQILPLTIPDMTGSPYSSYSAFAFNSSFISPEMLLREEACSESFLLSLEKEYADPVERKNRLLKCLFQSRAFRGRIEKEFETFQVTQEYWLKDFALFTSFMEHLGPLWTEWPGQYRDRDAEALARWSEEHREELEHHAFRQFMFYRQWSALRQYAGGRGVQIIGDIPIFVAHNSADVWAHRDIFKLDEEGFPTVVAGVPPDVFSATGQLWGNPHYRWDVLADQDYRWWFRRIEHLLEMVDHVRLDHFRGFEAAWEVPYGNKTAEAGEWVKGGGQGFFDAFRDHFGQPPIIAEDLGIITPEVEFLMERYNFPGMKILQFALTSGSDNPFLPWNYGDGRCVVYTGTHDNNTLSGWYSHITEQERENLFDFLGIEGPDIVWPMIGKAVESNAVWAVFPAQDILELGEEARMNLPNTVTGNWEWRMTDLEDLREPLERLRDLCVLHER